MNLENLLSFAEDLLSKKLIEAGVDLGHSLEHSIAVMRHAEQALKHEPNLTPSRHINVIFSGFTT